MLLHYCEETINSKFSEHWNLKALKYLVNCMLCWYSDKWSEGINYINKYWELTLQYSEYDNKDAHECFKNIVALYTRQDLS
ncbi:unnamed protein product [Blepharisma stoltei]|uniref:Uncharacterized protein n=1 Tax=Blepharisma stoltei TaxID=1481888 RepID=A0AAU9JGM5_9CILI|nr:unnamed protein product [Blepharisma stoltei]